jgi:hypothetical protein
MTSALSYKQIDGGLAILLGQGVISEDYYSFPQHRKQIIFARHAAVPFGAASARRMLVGYAIK